MVCLYLFFVRSLLDKSNHLTLCPPQYYEMSYGLNIEMHKQVLFLSISAFPLPLLCLGFDIFGVCLLTCPCVRICSFVCGWMCVYL